MSGKLLILRKMLMQLTASGHRTLIFSQSRRMLDVIESVLKDPSSRISVPRQKNTNKNKKNAPEESEGEENTSSDFGRERQTGGDSTTFSAEAGSSSLDQDSASSLCDFSETVQPRLAEKRNIRCTRLDGTVIGTGKRQALIDQFNSPSDSSTAPDCMLLTTQVGALGITLTGADRVIIFDPAWNPTVDSQVRLCLSQGKHPACLP